MYLIDNQISSLKLKSMVYNFEIFVKITVFQYKKK